MTEEETHCHIMTDLHFEQDSLKTGISYSLYYLSAPIIIPSHGIWNLLSWALLNSIVPVYRLDEGAIYEQKSW